MSERPTPETDAARHDLSDYGSPVLCSWGDWIPVDVACRLERERDKARDLACVYQHQYYMHVHPNTVVPYFSWENGPNK